VTDDYAVTVVMRVTVEDRAALLDAAGDDVPAAARGDEELAVGLALQALVPVAVLTDLPGTRPFRGEGWHAQVSAEKWRGDELPSG
jgi:hypothetical protein